MLITRVLQKLCEEDDLFLVIGNSTQLNIENKNKCSGFHILPQNSFYPIEWQEWKKYFDTPLHSKFDLYVQKQILKKSVGIHVWNKLSIDKKAKKSLRKHQFYTQLVYSQCPITYRFAPNSF